LQAERFKGAISAAGGGATAPSIHSTRESGHSFF
jgi:hypothetical protein